MSARSYRDYCEALDKLSKAAQLEFQAAWRRLDQSDPAAFRNALLVVFPGIVERYGRMAALAACQYYDAERAGAVPDDGYAASMADVAPVEQLRSKVRYAAGHFFEEG